MFACLFVFLQIWLSWITNLIGTNSMNIPRAPNTKWPNPLLQQTPQILIQAPPTKVGEGLVAMETRETGAGRGAQEAPPPVKVINHQLKIAIKAKLGTKVKVIRNRVTAKVKVTAEVKVTTEVMSPLDIGLVTGVERRPRADDLETEHLLDIRILKRVDLVGVPVEYMGVAKGGPVEGGLQGGGVQQGLGNRQGSGRRKFHHGLK